MFKLLLVLLVSQVSLAASWKPEWDKVLKDEIAKYPTIVGSNDFFDSCLDFYLVNGFLTPKQIKALNGLEEHHDEIDYYGGPEWWKD